MNWFMGGWQQMGIPQAWGLWVGPLLIVDLVLKGIALWRSARREEKGWFIALLVLNTLGILPAIYLLTHKERFSST